MIEKKVKEYLKKKLDVPALLEIPPKPPESYVLVEKTSGSMEDWIYSATIAIQSYGESKYQAAELNEKVKEAMIGNGKDTFGIISSENISSCKLNSDYPYDDLTRKKYRYQAVFDISY